MTQSQSCTVWMLQLTAVHLQGAVLSQLFRASQQAQAARDTSVHLQLQIAHITSGASCPCRLSSIFYALLDSTNLPSDIRAALISSKFNSWQWSSTKLTQLASGVPFTSDLLVPLSLQISQNAHKLEILIKGAL